MNKLTEIKNKLLNQTEEDYNNDFRKKYIPEQYNQIMLINELENENIDHYISISNRTDGKSFNYLHYFIDYSIRKGIGFTLIARHYTVRFAYVKLLEEIISSVNKKYKADKFYFIRNDFYILVGYEDKEIGIITDLNQATDLKYLSNYIKHFPIMVYDEFLAIEGDYLPDEWDRLKTIYSSINRDEDIPHIKFPKIFYLGNAVNFSSPVLANLKVFNILEEHNVNSMKTYNNIALEMLNNNNANEVRNLRAFKEVDDNLTIGQFEVNKHNLATNDYTNYINQNKLKIIIKDRKFYLVINYRLDTKDCILGVSNSEEKYHFNIELKDNNKKSIYLTSDFYDEEFPDKYNKDLFKFENQYSKDTILDTNFYLSHLKIYKIIKHFESEFVEHKPDNEIKEIQYKYNVLEQSKKNLVNKFFSI